MEKGESNERWLVPVSPSLARITRKVLVIRGSREGSNKIPSW